MKLKDTIPLCDVKDNLVSTDSITYQAKYDFLTNTLNRRSLIIALTEMCTAKQDESENVLHAYLFLDLDKFKQINDRYGHDTGDKLLVSVVKRINRLLGKEDILARMSGDEFAIILKNVHESSSDGLRRVNEVYAKLSTELTRPFILNQYEINTSASVGVKFFSNRVQNASDIIMHADVAMYHAKKKKKGSMAIYDAYLAQKFEDASILKKELEIAYKNNEYMFFFQPKVDVNTNKIKGVEILVRWKHPTRDILLPSAFFKEAADIGMISKITDLSIREACDFLSSTKELYDGTVSINVSSREITDTFFISDLIAIVQEYDIAPKRLELEITEDELIKNFDMAVILIRRLQEYGIAVSIDDFGTGYSSITYLHKLPVNTMKIDKSFIEHLYENQDTDREWVLLQTITDMAKAFNLKIVAEGVENEAQLAIVKSLGIDEYQGFLFSKAVDKESFLALVAQN